MSRGIPKKRRESTTFHVTVAHRKNNTFVIAHAISIYMMQISNNKRK